MNATGVTSASVGHKMFEQVLEYNNLEVVVNKREYGNGINTVLTGMILDLIKQDGFDLVITSDHGSHDRENITKIKEETGVDVIVTDHHLFNDDEAPYIADAFINPQRYKDSILIDMTGAGVLYFTLLHAKLMQDNASKEVMDRAYYLLTYVGLTIISDCMDLKNYINRKIIIKTLSDLNSLKIKHEPFWELVIKQNVSTYMIDETTLGYNVIPLLNSPGRIGDARLSYELMMSETYDIAEMLYNDIKEINTNRKDLQTKAVTVNKKEEYTDGVIKVMVIEESDGVQGIIANNVMYDENYKIVIVFTKNKRHDGYVYVGSGRSQEEGLNLEEVITAVSERSDIIIKHGGHKKAIGVKMKPDLKQFYTLLKEEVAKHKVVEKKITYVEDYIFSTKKLMLTMFDVIDTGPYGIGFERPTFCSDFVIESYRIYKRSNILLSCKVKFSKNSTSTMSLFYSVKKSELAELEESLKKSKYIRLAYSFNVNSFRNKNKILLQPTKLVFK
jgi:single-stranded-DNA-specific exonuclease